VGSTGRVFTAFQPAVGREVAIKIMRPTLANDPDFIRRFEAEARIVANLEHVRIVPIYDYWREHGSAFLVMRRFVGGSLNDTIGRGPLAADSVRRIVRQVGSALAAAHDQGVFHGDLRPGNVLIDGEGDAYLADFGMSYDQGVRPSDQEFLAPEQLDSHVSSPKADQHALGALARRLMTDRTDVPELDVVLGRVCDRRPTHRFDDVRSFVLAFVDSTAKL
jgi:serine/threonine protein kinase